MDKFNETMDRLGDKAMTIVEKYFDGKSPGGDLVNAALTIIGKDVVVRQQRRLDKHITRSQNIRIAQFVLDDPEVRREYMKKMHPDLAPFLKAPKKK